MHPMHCKCPTCVLPPIVHPTNCCVNHTCKNYVVPHIHPQHTTTVNHEFFAHQHYYPQTQSVVNEVTHQHFNAGPGPVPGGFPGPFPGAAPGGFPGPRPFFR